VCVFSFSFFFFEGGGGGGGGGLVYLRFSLPSLVKYFLIKKKIKTLVKYIAFLFFIFGFFGLQQGGEG
jgi:hypothetical protein